VDSDGRDSPYSGYYSFLTLVKEAYDHQRVIVETPEQASVKFPWVHNRLQLRIPVKVAT
jgi:hypothetical protein